MLWVILLVDEGETLMATATWYPIQTKWCELIGRDVALVELRVYPAEIMPDLPVYRVLSCKCSADVDCNLAGIPCKWAYNAPECDRFPMA